PLKSTTTPARGAFLFASAPRTIADYRLGISTTLKETVNSGFTSFFSQMTIQCWIRSASGGPDRHRSAARPQRQVFRLPSNLPDRVAPRRRREPAPCRMERLHETVDD